MMFLLTTILFVAVLSAVNAAIIVNIYDDDGKENTAIKEVYQGVQGCNNQTCDRVCRLLNFPGGICSNGRCKCNNIKETNELVPDNVKELGSCNWRACDQFCRRLGFPGGVCVGDKCKCDNFKLNNNKDLLSFNDLSANENQDTNECNNVVCENYCQQLGLVSGYCYQDRCICYKKEEKEEDNALQGCDVVACNEMCHRMNYIGGWCRNGSCYCY